MYSHDDSDDEDMPVLCMFCMLPISESHPAAPGYQFTCLSCARFTMFIPSVANITISMEEEDMFESEINRREQAQNAMSDC